MSACGGEGDLRDPQERTLPGTAPLGGEEGRHGQQCQGRACAPWGLLHGAFGKSQLNVSETSNNAKSGVIALELRCLAHRRAPRGVSLWLSPPKHTDSDPYGGQTLAGWIAKRGVFGCAVVDLK